MKPSDTPSSPPGGCARCGNPKQDWQVYCGAACAAEAEAKKPLDENESIARYGVPSRKL